MTRELLSAAQVAEILGVSPRRVTQLAEDRADFPAPAVVSRGQRRRVATRLWRASDIEAWAASADRSPGRPRKAQAL